MPSKCKSSPLNVRAPSNMSPTDACGGFALHVNKTPWNPEYKPPPEYNPPEYKPPTH